MCERTTHFLLIVVVLRHLTHHSLLQIDISYHYKLQDFFYCGIILKKWGWRLQDPFLSLQGGASTLLHLDTKP